ncbi:MAG: substrate-binding domain-containing protein [Spirochaetales bacterium]|nr:substrate-binding domain-containing protein [Spirochaetales bacterium]
MKLKEESNSENKKRLTIGLLLDNVYESYGIKIWAGLVDGIRIYDLNLICFVGGALKSPYKYIAQKNAVYDLVNMNNVDGLVAISGSLGNHIGIEYLKKFFLRYKPIPIVSVGVILQGFPSVLVDNTKGIRDILTHLIADHGFKKIAFIRGPECNPEAERRFQVYKDILEEHTIEYDPRLVAPGDFIRSTGTKAISLLLDERKVKFDALMGANDYMAIYAMKALQNRGIRVPQDIAIVGFDDIKESFGVLPSLTTVRQPLYEVGKQAASILVAKLKGEQVPETLVLPTQLIIRRSCGCFLHSSEENIISMLCDTSKKNSELSSSSLQEIERDLVEIMEKNLSFSREQVDVKNWVTMLIQALMKAKKEQYGSHFLFALEDFISVTTKMGIQALSIDIIISALFSRILKALPSNKEADWVDALWKQSLIFIGEVAERIQAYYRANAEEQSVILHKINQALITNFNMKRLKKVLVKDLPELGIKSCYLSLYENRKRRNNARLVFAYDEKDNFDFTSENLKFQANELVPGCIKREQGSFAFIVMPLYFKTEQLGFVLFEIGPISGTVYETLASQLSSALKGAKLVSKRKRLEKEITEVSRKEQQRIGQDLHDGLCQYLTGIAFMSNVLKDRLKAKSLEEAADAEEILKLLHHSIATTKNLARGLLPVELEEDGLVVALKDLAIKIEYQFKIPCHFRLNENIIINNSLVAVHLYRIVQEAVNNAIKHAKPDNIYIQLQRNNDKIHLSVRDDGIGLPQDFKMSKGMGLRTMKYRADIIDARIDIKRKDQRGTIVTCTFRNKPVHKTQAEKDLL